MNQLNYIFVFLCLATSCFAQYEGPYLLFGPKSLDELHVPSLQAIDDRTLRELYSNASSILIFVKNETTKLNYANFPKLSELIQKNSWLYLTQKALSSDPLDFNVNAEIFTLTGSSQQQDGEMSALFRDSQLAYGEKNVLGLLATRDLSESRRVKRQATESTTQSSTEEETDSSVMFEVKGKALLYSKSTPVLTVQKNSSTRTFNLERNPIITSDEKGDTFKLVLKYPSFTPDIGYIKFNFRNSSGNWALDQVELDGTLITATLNIRGTAPSAPSGFSFGCDEVFIYQYKNLSTSTIATLTVSMIQAQPYINAGEESKFSRVYECVGILTPAIASGIFVTFIIGIVLSIAISAIMDIKPPTKFETKGSKQLSFAVQE